MKLLFQKCDHVFELIEENILIITGTAVTLMILINALFRFIKVDWFGSEELTLFVGIWMYFIGSVCAARDNTHISGDMLNMFITNKKIVYVFDIIKNVISIGMALVFCIWSYQFLFWQHRLGASSAVYKVPTIISLIPISVFFTFWIIYLIRDLICLIQNRNHTESTESGGEQL